MPTVALRDEALWQLLSLLAGSEREGRMRSASGRKALRHGELADVTQIGR
jgi:hypothetical protein